MTISRLAHCLLAKKPYFGTALAARQGKIERHRYFRPTVRAAAAQRPGHLAILEVGSWAGSSAVTWATALSDEKLQGKVLCVDQWKAYFADEHDTFYKVMNSAAANEDIFNLFKHNISASGVGQNVSFVRGKSEEILPTLPREGFDVVYLDGSHYHEDVLRDIQNALGLVRNGGVICGDDLELQAGELADEDLCAALELRKDYVFFETWQASYHPGVTAAVAEILGSVSSWDGFWGTRIVNGLPEPLALDLAQCAVPQHLLSDLEADRTWMFDDGTDLSSVELSLEGHKGFNVVRCADVFYGILQGDGAFDIARVRAGAYARCVTAPSVDAVLRQIDSSDS